MGYPFEMCGGSSSRSIASVLLIGSSTAVPGGGGSPSTANSGGGTTTGTTAPAGSESSKKSQNGNINTSNSSNGGGGTSTTTTTKDDNGGKAFNTDTGMFPPSRPTTSSSTHEYEHGGHYRDREGRLKKETGHLDASSDSDEGSPAMPSVVLGSMKTETLAPTVCVPTTPFLLFYQARV
jgi:hypothetical protein